MNKHYSKRRVSGGLLALCLGTAVALVAPSVALGADSGTGGTVRATIGNDGSVTTVRQIASNGTNSAFVGELPIKLAITRTVSGNSQTYTYHVENTFSRTQTVHYTDTAGRERHTSVTLQLPLVAQLGVDAPRTMSDVNAPGAQVTAGANGTRHLLWNMVLFTPLGTSVQDVSFTATGRGTPVTELRATAVDPSTAPGLSAKSQDKTAEYQQADFWAGYASGGNDGLTKLAAGANELYLGLADALGGTNEAAAGSTQLAAGAKDLHSGLQEAAAGTQQAADGSTLLYKGSKQVHAGQGDLTSGLVQINAGQDALSAGLTQISGGLAQLNDPSTGLPAALPGIQQLIDGIGDAATPHTLLNGVAQLIGAIGAPATAGTLRNGVAQVQGGLGLLQTGIQQNAACAVDVLTLVNTGTPGVAPGADPCAASGLPPMPGLDPASSAVVSGLITQFSAVADGSDPTLAGAFAQLNGGLTAIDNGLVAMNAGLSSGNINDPGIKEGLQLTQGGLVQLKSGVGTAVAGIGQLAPGAASALDGSQTLSGFIGKAASGSNELFQGTGNGPKELTGGLRLLSSGLVDGAKQFPAAVDGAGQIADGLGQLSSGLTAGAQQFPAAVDGAKQVADGVNQVKAGATGPLAAQLTQASQNAHQQIAVLTAATGLASEAPGGAGTSYVLAQPGSFALAGVSTSSSGGDSHTGRNVALIAIGGVLALAIGLGVGVAMGRQSVSA